MIALSLPAMVGYPACSIPGTRSDFVRCLSRNAGSGAPAGADLAFVFAYLVTNLWFWHSDGEQIVLVG